MEAVSDACHICMGEHEAHYHASVRRLRQWMVRRIDLAAPPVAKPRVFVPPSDVVTLGLPTVEQRKRASRLGGRARGRR